MEKWIGHLPKRSRHQNKTAEISYIATDRAAIDRSATDRKCSHLYYQNQIETWKLSAQFT